MGRLDGQIAPLDDVSVGDAVRDLVTPASPGALLERGGFLEALEASWADAVDGRVIDGQRHPPGTRMIMIESQLL